MRHIFLYNTILPAFRLYQFSSFQTVHVLVCRPTFSHFQQLIQQKTQSQRANNCAENNKYISYRADVACAWNVVWADTCESTFAQSDGTCVVRRLLDCSRNIAMVATNVIFPLYGCTGTVTIVCTAINLIQSPNVILRTINITAVAFV